jgi:hypothetical protein
MRRLSRMVRTVAATIVTAALAGCISTATRHPVGVSAGPQADPRLYGTWRIVEPGKPTQYVFVIKAEKSNDLIVFSAFATEGGQGLALFYFATVGRVGDRTFVSLRQIASLKPLQFSGDYHPMLYRVDGDTLTVVGLDTDVLRRAIANGDIAGTIAGQPGPMPGEGRSTADAVVTAEPAELDAFVAGHVDELFTNEQASRLERVR